MSDLQRRRDEIAEFEKDLDSATRKALRPLPQEWRRPVAFFAAFHSDILKGIAGVATRMRFWIKDDGLTFEEANAIMRKLMTPEKCAAFQYAGQLLAEMAFLVADAVKARRAREATARLPDVREKTDPAVRALLDRIGNPFNDEKPSTPSKE